MGQKSQIEWTEATWNPVTGCSKVSPGCEHCYAERMAKRLRAMGQPNYAGGFEVATHAHMLNRPLEWKNSRIIFVDSMGDLFHKDVPVSFIQRVFGTIERADWHVFQMLTKRSERLADLAADLEWPRNLWVGVTVENRDYTFRIDHLRAVPAEVRFVSFEPLLGPIGEVDLSGIDWVIVGGESGPGARIMKEEWAMGLLRKCEESGIPFFFKQWGGTSRKEAGRVLNGQTYDEMPAGMEQYANRLSKSA